MGRALYVELEQLRARRSFAVFEISAYTGEGVEGLAAWLDGRMCAKNPIGG